MQGKTNKLKNVVGNITVERAREIVLAKILPLLIWSTINLAAFETWDESLLPRHCIFVLTLSLGDYTPIS